MPSKILVVDDEIVYWTRLIEQIFEEKIENNEYEFSYAKDGIEGLAKVNEIHPDIVLTDIKMPNLDGLAFLHQLNKSEQNVKSIIISAYGTIDHISQAMYERAYDFLVKPIDRQKLESSIRRILLVESELNQSKEILPPTNTKKQTSKVNYSSVLRLSKELPPPQQLKLVSDLVSQFSWEQINELEEKLPSLKLQIQENEDKQKVLEKEDEERIKQNKFPLNLLRQGYLEVLNQSRKTVSGEVRQYKYLCVRWIDPKTKKLRGRNLKKKDLKDPDVRRIIEEKMGRTIDFDNF
ncbi:serine/threonine protein kinase/response regulator/adenylate cyclase [Crocosphaera watsonii WH 0005]|uniref:Serine/threonine protein kinase/response regulator/adenylate cyclase n=1 Tax=Crocosphaera watsonii WH 0005 TaxID=423472 RepID=T2J0R3_CROWT|nr:response regulator [Crocosphaera watsonii]CCQ57990.1 serine/threonine protein kinase/response regulator/adenylate cyclase [Crocosphaera watsonii WH 0005]